jgi:mRNA interferase RelE/StbE
VKPYCLRYTRQAARDIKKLSPQIKERLKEKLEYFTSQEHPLKLAKRLTKPADAQYRYRVGDYRVLFDVEGNDIIVLHVQHRREVYRR